MKKHRYNLIDSLKILAERGVEIEGKYLMIKNAVQGWMLGNGCLGRIDYLKKIHHYKVINL